MFKILLVIIIFFTILGSILYPCYLYWDIFHLHGLSEKNQDWSNFGSFIGGVYSAAFGLVSTLILCATLYVTLNYNKKQLAQLKGDSVKNLLVHHINSLNEKLNSRQNKYFSPNNLNTLIVNESQYLTALKKRLEISIAVDQQNIQDWRFNPIKTTEKIVKETSISYPEEMASILNILSIIHNIKETELRKECVSLFSSLTNRNRTYWLVSYAFFNNEQAKKCVSANPDLWALADGLMP